METGAFNREQTLERLGGDEELLVEIAGIFVQAAQGKLQDMRRALEAGDADALARAAHSLKGSVANFSAERAWDAAKNLEMTARGGQLDLARPMADQLEFEVQTLSEELKNLQAESGLCGS